VQNITSELQHELRLCHLCCGDNAAADHNETNDNDQNAGQCFGNKLRKAFRMSPFNLKQLCIPAVAIVDTNSSDVVHTK
jgi:hypothetical protein